MAKNLSDKKTPPTKTKSAQAGARQYVREKLQGTKLILPSLITVTGTFCGFLALTNAFKGNYSYAAKCIGFAIVLDGLDGRLARTLNATSPFGREFDSLSDLIAFGVAPSILVYCWAFDSLADEHGILMSFFFVVCSATRLARFNVSAADEVEGGEEKGDETFFGLPTPGAAAAIAALVYAMPVRLESQSVVLCMFFYVGFLATMMVTTFPFLSIKKVKLTQGDPRINLVVLSLFVALIWKYSKIVLVLLSAGYALSGILGYGWRWIRPKNS